MAIKGKGRTRGRRSIAAPPRPQVVVRKPPLWRRRWVWATAGGIAVAAILAGVALSVRSARAEAGRERELAGVRRFTSQVHSALPEDRQALGQDMVFVYVEASQNAAGLSTGETSPGRARQSATELRRTAGETAEAIAAIPVAELVPEERSETRSLLLDSQFLLAESFRLYGAGGELLGMASNAEEAQREALSSRAQEVLGRGGTLFARGYQKLVEAFTRLEAEPPPVPVVREPTPQPPREEPADEEEPAPEDEG